MKRILVMLVCVVSVNAFAMGRGMEFGQPAPRDDKPMFERQGGMEFLLVDFSDPEARKMFDKYKEKMEDVFLESRKERNSLQNKRRDLFFTLRELKEKYKRDKTVSKDIVKTIKEINEVTERLQDLNQKTMDKLRQLNEERRKEFNEYSKKWIDSLEKDETKLSNFLERFDDFERGDRGKRKKK